LGEVWDDGGRIHENEAKHSGKEKTMNEGEKLVRLDPCITLEIPGFLPIQLEDGWAVISTWDRKIIECGFPTELEARKRAGTAYILLQVKAVVENRLQAVVAECVRAFMEFPKIDSCDLDWLIAEIRGQVSLCLEDFPSWAKANRELQV